MPAANASSVGAPSSMTHALAAKAPPPRNETSSGPHRSMSEPTTSDGANIARKWTVSTRLALSNEKPASTTASVIGPMSISIVVCASVVTATARQMSARATSAHSGARARGGGAAGARGKRTGSSASALTASSAATKTKLCAATEKRGRAPKSARASAAPAGPANAARQPPVMTSATATLSGHGAHTSTAAKR